MVYLQFRARDMSSLSVRFKMCSRFIWVVLEGGCGIFHPRGVCITWLPYFSVAGGRKSLLQVRKGRMGNRRATNGRALSSSAHRSCL